MDIGIGLPSGMPNVPGPLVLDWARKADAAGFSSLGVIDRIVYGNYEPMSVLAAAGAVTQRARLITVILMATLRNAGVLAKAAASIDNLSGGRLTLGLAVGSREDDFRAAPADPRGRGRPFEGQLTAMRRIWAGDEVGPTPVQAGGPPVLIGGSAPPALRRAGRMGDGYIAGTRDAPQIIEAFNIVEEAWKEAGRTGRPHLAAIRYFALGPDARERGSKAIADYYSFGPDRALTSLVATPEGVKAHTKACADVGVDELVWLPSIPEVDQVARLREVLG
jgi:alkanesulfonate monooxygenase SsuD/methylene tetrahydromethanopterin reductase-like flavin-dependent oxidoreductase (luciferase family)